ncbi:serine hydrolase domain-containing protein [Spirosoma foliorum]|uniref:Beta-lactamase family protein n=1 Tax=Spirosoma foliorum TaxID=2710596 RepID=A0A7G5GUE8_9BACT|nr:serine hydrolase domain-containing protein [Spirosoma foliorum]QMW02490.1 beta-lactamase family protein [Spirosoma foliorum]
MTRKWTLVAIRSLFALTMAPAQPLTSRLDSLFRGALTPTMLNGTRLVAQRGQSVYQQDFGYGYVERKCLNQLAPRFQLAALAKVWTSGVILQLYEMGKTRLNDAFSRYFPAFPDPAIPIRQLLPHPSAWSDQYLPAALTSAEKKQGHWLHKENLVPVMGYELLVTLVEPVAAQPVHQYVAKRILAPAGMTLTVLLTLDTPPLPLPDKANNYDYAFGYSPSKSRVELKKTDYVEKTYGPTNVFSTVGDLLRVDQALYRDQLLTQKTRQLAFSLDTLCYGKSNAGWHNGGGMGHSFDQLCWFIFQDAGKTTQHTGGYAGSGDDPVAEY